MRGPWLLLNAMIHGVSSDAHRNAHGWRKNLEVSGRDEHALSIRQECLCVQPTETVSVSVVIFGADGQVHGALPHLALRCAAELMFLLHFAQMG